MKDQRNFPFTNKPVKTLYMWRDIERRAGMYGLPILVPAPYPPTQLDLPNRIALLAVCEGWCAAYVKAAYHRWMVHGEPVDGRLNIASSLRDVGQDEDRVLQAAESREIGDALQSATDEARNLNIFGSPTFILRGELFWGDDRLDDAIKWYRRGSLSPA